MTVALWDYKQVEFKRSQHIRAPVNQAGPSARVLRAPECLVDLCLDSCPRCSGVSAPVRVRACVRTIGEWKDQRQRQLGAVQSVLCLIPPLLSTIDSAKYGGELWAQDAERDASLSEGGGKDVLLPA